MTPQQARLLNAINDRIQDSDLPIDKTGFAVRAEAYIDVLDAANTAVRAFPQYQDTRFHAALDDVGLMTGLAVNLDRYLSLVILREVNVAGADAPTTEADYLAFLAQHIQQPAAQLRTTYPMLVHALERASGNFQQSLQRLLGRLNDDWQNLNAVFGPGLATVQRVAGTGSDFHKGGQQTLILTFGSTAGVPVKVIYKPTDLELDYWIAGDTAHAATLAMPAAPSLFEILNAHEQKEAYRLPTYRIFPAVRGATAPNIADAIRNSYGYLEFIEYQSQAAEAQRSTFYFILGKLAAIAASLAMRDVNQENVIVSGGRPYLIDMEASLLGGPTSAGGSGLLSNLTKNTSLTSAFGFNADMQRFGEIRFTNHTQNVLLDHEHPVNARPYLPFLAGGYSRALRLLRDAGEAVGDWAGRLEQVTARNVPIPTQVFHQWFTAIYTPRVRQGANVYTVDAACAWYEKDRTAEYQDNFTTWSRALEKDRWALPGFWAGDFAVADFRNLDIPSFYGRPTTAELYDSAGHALRPRSGPGLVPPRETYFTAPPIDELRHQLTDEVLAERSRNVVRDIAAALHLEPTDVLGGAHQFLKQPAA